MLTAEEVGPPAVIVAPESGVWIHVHPTDRVFYGSPAPALSAAIVPRGIVSVFFVVHEKSPSKAQWFQFFDSPNNRPDVRNAEPI
jgi:hypothetical protein